MRTLCALRAVVVATTTAVVISLAGCAAGGAEIETSHLPVNSADVAFAQRMIVHHKQAIEMSAMATTRSRNAAVTGLAVSVDRAHSEGIAVLTELLKDWGQPVQPELDGSAPAVDASPSAGGSGQIGEADLARLRASSGAAFDRLLLVLMIEHHKEGISIVRLQQEVGQSPRARGVADGIEADHTAELTAMQKLISSLSDPPR